MQTLLLRAAALCVALFLIAIFRGGVGWKRIRKRAR
jgi:hypothetical protein